MLYHHRMIWFWMYTMHFGVAIKRTPLFSVRSAFAPEQNFGGVPMTACARNRTFKKCNLKCKNLQKQFKSCSRFIITNNVRERIFLSFECPVCGLHSVHCACGPHYRTVHVPLIATGELPIFTWNAVNVFFFFQATNAAIQRSWEFVDETDVTLYSVEFECRMWVTYR